MPQFQKVVTHLCFDGNAEEAVNFYVSLMEDSRIVNIVRHGPAGPGPEGTVMAVTFQLEGQEFMALNGGPDSVFSPSISLFLKCETQEEIDRLWEQLADGGEPMRCGWLRDKFGLTWQIAPTLLVEMIHDKDEQKVARVMTAMQTMAKFEIAPLKAAFGAGGEAS